jgi:hypothetical protein
VRLDGVGRETDQLDTTLGEFRLELCECAELGGADGRVVFRVGEEDDPVVANEFVEVDWALSGLSLEVWRGGSETETAELKPLAICAGHMGVECISTAFWALCVKSLSWVRECIWKRGKEEGGRRLLRVGGLRQHR